MSRLGRARTRAAHARAGDRLGARHGDPLQRRPGPLARLLRHRHPRVGAADRRAARVRLAARAAARHRRTRTPRSCSTSARSRGSCSSSPRSPAGRTTTPWVYRGGIFVFSVACALLIAAVVHPAGRIRRVLGLAPFVWIGRRSYGIYLWHWPIMALTRPGLDLEWTRWVLVPLQIGAAVGIAALSYKYVEMPIRSGEGRKRIAAWMRRRPPRRRLAIAAATVLAIALPVAWIGSLDAPAQERALTKVRSSAAAAAPAGNATAGQPDSEPSGATTDGQQAKIDKTETPLAVGASVMLAAQTALGRHATVDAAVGRQSRGHHRPARGLQGVGSAAGPRDRPDGRERPGLGRRTSSGCARCSRTSRRSCSSTSACRAAGRTRSTGSSRRRSPTGRRRTSSTGTTRASPSPACSTTTATHPNPDGQEVYAKLVERALREHG